MFLKYLTKSPHFRYLKFLIVHRSRASFENKLRIFAIVNGLLGIVLFVLAIIAVLKDWNLTAKHYWLVACPLAILFCVTIIFWTKLEENGKIYTYKYLFPGFLIYVSIVNCLHAMSDGVSMILIYVPGLLLSAVVLYEIFEGARIFYNNSDESHSSTQVR